MDITLPQPVVELTPQITLEAVKEGTVDQLIRSLPEGLQPTADRWVKQIAATIASTLLKVATAYNNAPKNDQNTFALWVQDNHPEIAHYLFEWHKNKPLTRTVIQKTDWGFLDA